MMGTNQQLIGLLYAVSELEPENDSAEALCAYFQQTAWYWYQVAGLLVHESIATQELFMEFKAAMAEAGIEPERLLN